MSGEADLACKMGKGVQVNQAVGPLNILNGGSVVAQKNRPYVVGILSFIPSKTSPTGGSVVA